MVRDGIKTEIKRKTRYSPIGTIFNYQKKKCLMCGLEFKPNTNVAKYCSLTCQNRNRRQRKADWIRNYNLNYSKNNPEKTKEWRNKSNIQWKKDNPEKCKAQTMAQIIPLKSECEICGHKKGLERHHWDYNKPLLVNTLCKVCHRIQHTKHFNQSSFGGVKR
jgi:hypothetical protein